MGDRLGRVGSARRLDRAVRRGLVRFFLFLPPGVFCIAPVDAAVVRVPADRSTIQGALDAAMPGDEIVVADGVWSGPGNVDLDFRGKAMTLRSERGARFCVIDAGGSEARRARAFYFHSGESADSVVEGFTIRGGYADQHGGAILCIGSSPTIRNCVILGNAAGGPPLPNLSAAAAYWSFNESSGAIAHDRIGGNDGVISSATWTTGISGTALYFTVGSNSKAVIPSSSALQPGGGFTVAAWIKGTYSTTDTHTIASLGESYYLGISKGHLFGQIRTAGGVAPDRPVLGATRLASDQWYHVVMTYDASEGGVEADLDTYTGMRPEANNPVIPAGSASDWDKVLREIGNVFYDPDEPDAGLRYKLFYSGHTGSYAGNNVYVGMAGSPDATTWTKYGKVHDRPLEDPYVVKHDGVYYLYAEDKFDVPFRNIRLLTSTDARTWVDQGDVFDVQPGGTPRNWEANDVSSPVVWIEGDTWHLMYEGRGGGTSGRVGHATSSDGRNWVRDPRNPVFVNGPPGSWDESNVVGDDLVKIGDTYYFWYHGYGYPQTSGFWTGMATSTDLFHWTRYAFNPVAFADTVMVLHEGDRYSFFLVDTEEGGGGGISKFRPFVISAPRLYVNGMEEGYWRRMDAANLPLASDGLPLVIGRAASGAARPFVGAIDEVRVHRRALGASELRSPWDELGSTSGGAIACKADSRPTFAGCVIHGNRAAGVGGAAYAAAGGRPAFVNCTITSNVAEGGPGGAMLVQDGADLSNVIVWSNVSTFGGSVFGPVSASFSDIEGGWSGVENFAAEPRFVAPLGGDFRLSADSPCVNAGDPTMSATSSLSDLSGQQRVMCGRIDVGAYEFGAGDTDCNRRINLIDFGVVRGCLSGPGGGLAGPACKGVDFDSDGDVDLDDLSDFQDIFQPGAP